MQISLPGELVLTPLYRLALACSTQPSWTFDASKKSHPDYLDLFIVREDSRENGCYALALSDRLGDVHKALWVIHIEKSALFGKGTQTIVDKTHFYKIYSATEDNVVSACPVIHSKLDDEVKKEMLPFLIGLLYGTYMRIRETYANPVPKFITSGEWHD